VRNRSAVAGVRDPGDRSRSWCVGILEFLGGELDRGDGEGGGEKGGGGLEAVRLEGKAWVGEW